MQNVLPNYPFYCRTFFLQCTLWSMCTVSMVDALIRKEAYSHRPPIARYLGDIYQTRPFFLTVSLNNL